jgi:CRP-like cAMP-binding protein
MTERRYRRGGDIFFKKDDVATEMFLTVTGTFLVTEIGVELPPGRLMGELAFLTPDRPRTAKVDCIEDRQVLTITYERLLEIYFQSPLFGYYFLLLTGQRRWRTSRGWNELSHKRKPRGCRSSRMT